MAVLFSSNAMSLYSQEDNNTLSILLSEISAIPPTQLFNEDGSWHNHDAPFPPLSLQHTDCTSSSHALPASLLFNTVSFVMYQTQISTYCPHICCGRRSLPQWCSGCCPILSWINTGAICRLADTEMFVFQGNPPPSLYSSWPLPSQTQRRRDGKRLQLLQVTLISSSRATVAGRETRMTWNLVFGVKIINKVVRGPM